MQYFTLNTGRQVPVIGFGTWEIKPSDQARQAVTNALNVGYRVIDTAKIYGNEDGVGAALSESDAPREDLFITTKLWNEDQGYDHALQACQQSLETLGLDYLDLYLIHWPATTKRHDTWRAFEKLYKDGLIKAAGVSNYTVDHLKELKDRSGLTPAVNQVEFHPFIYEQQRPLLDYCAEEGILIEAYSPLNRVSSDGHDSISKIAKNHNKSPQQIALRWCAQHNTLPLSRSTSAEHTEDNFNIFDFELSKADMAALNDLSDGERVTWDPAGMGSRPQNPPNSVK